jgi:hypothetical protein
MPKHTIHMDEKTYADFIRIVEGVGHLRDTWDAYDISDERLLEMGEARLDLSTELIVTGRRLFVQLKPLLKVFVRIKNGGPLEVAVDVKKNNEIIWDETEPCWGHIFPEVDLAVAAKNPEGMFVSLEEAEGILEALRKAEEGDKFAGSNI